MRCCFYNRVIYREDCGIVGGDIFLDVDVPRWVKYKNVMKTPTTGVVHLYEDTSRDS